MPRRGRSRVAGVPQLRRTLRRIPDESRELLADTLQVAGRRLLVRAKAETPVRSGALRAALDFRVARKTLKLRLGLLRRKQQRDLFYGYILDVGRKAQVVSRRSRGGGRHRYRVKAIPRLRYEFVFGRRKDFLRNEIDDMRRALNLALKRAARG